MKDTTDPPPITRTSIRLDLEDWMPYLADYDIPEVDKIALIETLWAIMMSFVDHGCDIDVAEISSGQSFDLTAVLQEAVLNSKEKEDV